METSELELAFYRSLIGLRSPEETMASRGGHSSPLFARMLADPAPFRLPLAGGRTAILERLGGRDARWRVQIAAPEGEPKVVDTRTVEHHFDTGWSWLRALQANALGMKILEHALDRLPSAVFVLDGTGRVLLQNGLLEVLPSPRFCRGPGVALAVDAGDLLRADDGGLRGLGGRCCRCNTC